MEVITQISVETLREALAQEKGWKLGNSGHYASGCYWVDAERWLDGHLERTITLQEATPGEWDKLGLKGR